MLFEIKPLSYNLIDPIMCGRLIPKIGFFVGKWITEGLYHKSSFNKKLLSLTRLTDNYHYDKNN